MLRFTTSYKIHLKRKSENIIELWKNRIKTNKTMTYKNSEKKNGEITEKRKMYNKKTRAIKKTDQCSNRWVKKNKPMKKQYSKKTKLRNNRIVKKHITVILSIHNHRKQYFIVNWGLVYFELVKWKYLIANSTNIFAFWVLFYHIPQTSSRHSPYNLYTGWC